jgi:CheY-like chemotaxis protein
MVSLEVDDGWAIARVRDTGMGIAPELLPHIFDKFRQGDVGTARHHGGLGLGLTIVRELVAMHHGTVQVESAGLGQGATFTVRLPSAPGKALPAAPAEVAATRPLEHARALVVDDDLDGRTWITALMESAGAAASGAASTEAALAILDQGPIDIVISDIGMPGRDGFDLIRTMRERGHRMPAVAVTAFSSPEDAQRILSGGYLRHFSKPIQPAALVAEIAAILRAHVGS